MSIYSGRGASETVRAFPGRNKTDGGGTVVVPRRDPRPSDYPLRAPRLLRRRALSLALSLTRALRPPPPCLPPRRRRRRAGKGDPSSTTSSSSRPLRIGGSGGGPLHRPRTEIGAAENSWSAATSAAAADRHATVRRGRGPRAAERTAPRGPASTRGPRRRPEEAGAVPDDVEAEEAARPLPEGGGPAGGPTEGTRRSAPPAGGGLWRATGVGGDSRGTSGFWG